MRRPIGMGLGVALLLLGVMAPAMATAAAAPKDSAQRAKARDGWPDTKAGDLGRLWVQAFSTGEAAMREFNEKHLTTESLAKKSAAKRVESYRKFHDQYGALMLAKVIKSTPGEITVSLMDADGAPHEFIFAVQTAAPFKLLSVSIREQHHGHGSGGFSH
jgi:hypothetical protein